MGLLVLGTPLEWEDALDWLSYVNEHGIEQFLQTYERVKDLSGDELKWGDEVEYGILEVHPESKQVKLSLRGAELVQALNEKEKHAETEFSEGCNWLPEYGAWMIEATPSVPYGKYAKDLLRVEKNMRLRRIRLLSMLTENEIAPSVTCFPLLGVPLHDEKVFTTSLQDTNGPIAQSDYVGDDVIHPHSRFGTLTANIRKRRGCKIDIRVPLFQDAQTNMGTENSETVLEEESSREWKAEGSRPALMVASRSSSGSSSSSSSTDTPSRNGGVSPPAIPTTASSSAQEPYPGFVHMDAMAFGMGMCCLQVTFQATNIGESRHLYDHLAVISPIFLALTAATPVLKGHLVDTDVRWATIASAVDDRTPEEKGEREKVPDELKNAYEKMVGKGVRPLRKSRYEGISLYICNHKCGLEPDCSSSLYNDIDISYDEASYKTLVDRGIDTTLAKHVAHLFIRDPLVIYEQRLHLNDAKDTDHFENIQSTNWQTVRWKPPPPPKEDGSSPHVGWRTEFRSMEIQITDFENAAFSCFVVLVSRVILAFELNLYIPLSKVEYNMEVAHRVNAVSNEKFYFRSHLAPPFSEDCCEKEKKCTIHADVNHYELMSICEIMCGKGSYYPGLIPLVRAYLDELECGDETNELLSKYLCLIEKRARGELPTTATWMRTFIQNHRDYNHDSIVSSSTVYDLLELCKDIGEGKTACPELLGDVVITPIRKTSAYATPLTSQKMKVAKLLHRYAQREKPSSCSASS